MIHWLTGSTNDVSTHLCHKSNGMIFAFVGSGSGVLNGDWRRNFFKLEMVFLFCSHDSFFLQGNVYDNHQTR